MRAARELVARYAGTCADCGQPIEVGAEITYRRPDAVHRACTLPETPTTTHRERLEARADRRDSWAETRAARATADLERGSKMLDAIPFGQPILVGHYSEGRDRRYRGRAVGAIDRGLDGRRAAENHASRAEGIRSQLAGAIYDDDPDAVERLAEKLEKLEAQRSAMKASNAEFRKTHRAQLKEMTPYQRNQAMPHQSYELQNLGGNITRTRQRLARLERQANR